MPGSARAFESVGVLFVGCRTVNLIPESLPGPSCRRAVVLLGEGNQRKFCLEAAGEADLQGGEGGKHITAENIKVCLWVFAHNQERLDQQCAVAQRRFL